MCGGYPLAKKEIGRERTNSPVSMLIDICDYWFLSSTPQAGSWKIAAVNSKLIAILQINFCQTYYWPHVTGIIEALVEQTRSLDSCCSKQHSNYTTSASRSLWITLVYSKMDRVQGNLTNGTYIAICNMNKDNNVAKVEPKGNGFELLGTTDRNHENTGVCTISTPAGIFYPYS